jgi:hypothetical protein
MRKFFTDYPFEEDDHSIKEVTLLAYDDNKYAIVEWNSERYECKLGYLYYDEQMTKILLHAHPAVIAVSHDPDDRLTRKQIARKRKARKPKIRYCIYIYFTVGRDCVKISLKTRKNTSKVLERMRHKEGVRDIAIYRQHKDSWDVYCQPPNS